MAAPSGTVWGSIVGGYGKIGLYTKTSSTNTSTSVSVEVWFASKYSVSDTSNTLYFDNLASSGSASTSKGSFSISTTVNSGSGWSTTNQVKLATYSYSYNHGTSASTRYIYAKLANVDRVGGTMSVGVTVTIPALYKYTIIYHGNPSSGADNVPENSYKYYGKSVTLSTTKPTRTGHVFQNWNTKSDGSGTAYASGATYSANATTTLYAIWKANTYTVTYNANGGTGAPSNQTKTYGKTLTLSSVKPTRTNYIFKGWATSSTATTATYAVGASYTSNANLNLFAVWELGYTKPRITNVVVSRSDSSGNISDDGPWCLVQFDWETDLDVKSVLVENKKQSDTSWFGGGYSFATSGTSGRVNSVIVSNDSSEPYDLEYTYQIRITVSDGTVTDSTKTTTIIRTLPSLMLPIDVRPPQKGEELGVSIGKTAEKPGCFDVGLKSYFRGGIEAVKLETSAGTGVDLNDIVTPNVYRSVNKAASTYSNLPSGISGTFTLEVLDAGDEGQLMQRITCCSNNPLEYVRHYYSGSWQKWIRKFGVTLYHVDAGTSGTVTLSESAANFKTIEIYFGDNNLYGRGYLKLHSPNNKLVDLSLIEPANSTTTYIRRTRYTIAGTTITPTTDSSGYVTIQNGNVGNHMPNNHIKITKVIGYEYEM